MIAVSIKSTVGIPVPPVGAESDIATGSVDAKRAFQLLYGASDAKATKSGLPSSDQDDKDLLLKDAEEDRFPVDAVCTAPVLHQPIAQGFTALPLPTANLLGPNIKNAASVDTKPVAPAAFDAKTPVPQDLNPSPTVAVAAETDAASEIRQPVVMEEPKSPRSAERAPQLLQNDVALPPDVQITIEKVTSAPPFSIAENTLRQKWAGSASPVADDENTANLTVDPDAGEVSIPKTVPAAAGMAGSPEGSKALSFAPSASPHGLAGVDHGPSAKLAKPVANSETAPDVDNPDIFAIDRGSNAFGPEPTTSVTAGQPDIGASLVAPKHMIHGAMVAALAPSVPNLSGTIATHVGVMSKNHDNGPLELSLSPDELGKLTISIKQEGNFVHVTLTADRPETLDLMRRNASDLVADLRQTGFSGASLSFGQGQKDQNPSFRHTAPMARNNQLAQSLLPETKPTAPGQSQNGAGVDLRF